ncbi:tetratricopeptide repeat protein 38-like isoform X2 [Gordionus sp. m RMFG-2023]|uniref:tetratricopeptide repeat protein 38-like isoform X2 n=1 Tax=Gordionus sp. m RMFG-2023 TaxID=3053472 RepID=UPI0031FC2AA3
MVFSKSDDDSCILYDLILRQYITLLDDPKMLSLAENINQIATYKEFVMGNVLTLGLHLVSGLVDPVNDDKFSTKLQILLSNVENNAIKDFHSNLINNEDLHIKAIKLLSKKQFVEAIDIWKKIIEKNPKDLLAVKLCHDVCFYMCNMDKMINIYILVTKYLDRNHPLYSYILAMFAFAKIELFCYHEAESLARESLILNPLNAWGTHSLIHVYTMQANIDDGINFLVNTHSDWKQTQFLACHLYWHMGLLYLEKNDVDTAFEIFQRQLKVRVKESLALFHLTDAVSLLYRINHTANINTRIKSCLPFEWSFLAKEIASIFINCHFWPFNVAHIGLALSMCQSYESKFLDFADQMEMQIMKKVKKEIINGNYSSNDQNECFREVNIDKTINICRKDTGTIVDIRDTIHKFMETLEQHKELYPDADLQTSSKIITLMRYMIFMQAQISKYMNDE